PLEDASSPLTVSLQTKILASYLIVGGALLFAMPEIYERISNRYAASALILGITLALGAFLTWSLARVARIVRLKVSAVEISSGDLSKSVVSEEQQFLHDEIDDLTV